MTNPFAFAKDIKAFSQAVETVRKSNPMLPVEEIEAEYNKIVGTKAEEPKAEEPKAEEPKKTTNKKTK